jgi:DNA-binding transcriptional LysR family regulator
MDLEHLHAFVDVMRLGSFTAAARQADVDPSHVSRVIAALEDELGVRLFQRTTRRLAPTEAGRVYFERIEPLIDELERAQSAARDIGERPKGTLRVHSPVSFGLQNVVPLLPDFARRYPELHFDLLLNDAQPDLVTERIDIALRLESPGDGGLVGQRLAPLRAVVCASPDYLCKHGRPGAPEDLAAHNCMTLDYVPGFDATWRFRSRDGRRIELEAKGTLRSSNAIALKECALAGMGVVLQARWIVGRELTDGRLVDLFPQYDVSAQATEAPAIWIVQPSRTYVPLKVRLFAAFLRESISETSPWERSPEIPR